MKTKRLETDVLIIGGGTAGCFAAYTLRNLVDSSMEYSQVGHEMYYI